MEKRLVRVGNGYGVLIDKSVRALLDITPQTFLRVWTDGRRLVLEPIVERQLVLPPEELEMRIVIRQLMDYHGLDREQVTAIQELERRCFSAARAESWANGLADGATPRDLQIAKRYRSCLAARRAGIAWDAAIDRATREFPLPPAKPAATSVAS